MAGSARIGQFSVGDGQYGVPVSAAKPADNAQAPSTLTLAEQTAKTAQAELDALYQQLKAAAAATN